MDSSRYSSSSAVACLWAKLALEFLELALKFSEHVRLRPLWIFSHTTARFEFIIIFLYYFSEVSYTVEFSWNSRTWTRYFSAIEPWVHRALVICSFPLSSYFALAWVWVLLYQVKLVHWIYLGIILQYFPYWFNLTPNTYCYGGLIFMRKFMLDKILKFTSINDIICFGALNIYVIFWEIYDS